MVGEEGGEEGGAGEPGQGKERLGNTESCTVGYSNFED